MAAQKPPRLRFARAARIKQGRDFARVRQAGERLVVGCLKAYGQNRGEEQHCRRTQIK